MSAINHYPRRFRWRASRDRDKRRNSASLTVNGRAAGGVIRYSNGRGWSAGGADGSELHGSPYARRCDAKRAVEMAAVAAEKRSERQ